MRILISGGGIAGLTLAAKLRQQPGREVVIVERAASYDEGAGYSLGLWPLGSSVLHGIGVYDAFVAGGRKLTTYEMADHRGEAIQRMDMAELLGDRGEFICTERAALLDALLPATEGVERRMGSAIMTLDPGEAAGARAVTTLDDGTEEEWDVVVGCDGMHSNVRSLIFEQPETFDAGWGAYAWWSTTSRFPADLTREYWGRGTFFGVYPVKDRETYIAGVPLDGIDDPRGPFDAVGPQVRARFADLTGQVPQVDAAFDDATDWYLWPMADVRAHEWTRGRVVLCGDAATGFLPTAGAGASNAIRGAAALADELSKVDGARAGRGLKLFEARARKIIEANQQDSRKLAKAMFVEHRMLSWGRDELLRHYPVERMAASLRASMDIPF